MTKILFTLILLTFFNTPIMAKSCFPIYEDYSKKLLTENEAHNRAMSDLQVMAGAGSFIPYEPIIANNWPQHFVNAVKFGPTFPGFSSGPEEDWLHAFHKSIKKHCKLPNDNSHQVLRSMLTELMEDGSFCPNGKILKLKFFNQKKRFKDVLVRAVKDQRFADKCHDKAVTDDSFRDVKEIHTPSSSEGNKSGSGASQQ